MTRSMMLLIHGITWGLIIALQVINEIAFGPPETLAYQLSLIFLFALTQISVFYFFYSFLGNLIQQQLIAFVLLGVLVCYCIPNIYSWLFFQFVVDAVSANSSAQWSFKNSLYFSTDGIVMGIVGTIAHIAKQGLKKRETELLMVKEKTEQELQALKSKVNPHFLFNTLNSIYYLVRTQKPEAPEAVLLLSDNMRYMLEASQLAKVPLLKEIEASEKLISLIKLRVSKDFDTQMDVQISIEHEIIPTLLINLIENALKHGDMSDEGFIHVSVISTQQAVYIACKNKVNSTLGKSVPSTKKFGLTSLERVLQLCYPQSHALEINNTASFFEVQLKIELQ